MEIRSDIILLAACTALLVSGNSVAGDIARGRLLYENHCQACHRSVVHVREDRKALTIELLRDQVRRWSGNAGLVWSNEEIEDVVLYLDSRYYHFVLSPR